MDGAEWSYEAAIAYLVDHHGIPEMEVRDGSVPEPSLNLIAKRFAGYRNVLHIGNFVGISLGHLLAGLGSSVVIVSVDPNMPHRGVERTQDVVVDLLDHFCLSDHHALICGYSLEKSMSNDGRVTHSGYDPSVEYEVEKAPEGVLPALYALGLRFGAAFIDGNHDPEYLRRELLALIPLITVHGLVALDDVDEHWPDVVEVFEEVAGSDGWPFKEVIRDGRVGLLRRMP